MKATLLVRRAGLRKRMPQEPLDFLSDMNTLCMKMTAKRRSRDGAKHRKAVLRDMKKLAPAASATMPDGTSTSSPPGTPRPSSNPGRSSR